MWIRWNVCLTAFIFKYTTCILHLNVVYFFWNARSELAGVRSVVSLLARRVAKRRDMFLAGARLARRCAALGAYAGAARRRRFWLAEGFVYL